MENTIGPKTGRTLSATFCILLISNVVTGGSGWESNPIPDDHTERSVAENASQPGEINHLVERAAPRATPEGVTDRPQNRPQRPIREAAKDVVWMAGAGALDILATRQALGRCPTCYEANPLMQSTGKALATKAVATAAGGFICYELRKHGHERAAKWFRWGIVGLWSGLAVNARLRGR